MSTISLKNIQSLTDFKRNTAELVEKIESSGRPMVLTVNGKAKLVVQDAESYQKMLEALDHAETIEGIQRGLKAIDQGKVHPVKAAFEGIRRKHRIPRAKKT